MANKPDLDSEEFKRKHLVNSILHVSGLAETSWRELRLLAGIREEMLTLIFNAPEHYAILAWGVLKSYNPTLQELLDIQSLGPKIIRAEVSAMLSRFQLPQSNLQIAST